MTDPMVTLNPVDDERFLASLLLSVGSRTLRDEALEKVADEDFCDGLLAGLWATARSLRAEGKRIDRRTLISSASAPKRSVEQLLDGLATTLPMPQDYPHAVAEVQRCGQLRRLFEVLQRSTQRALSAEDFSQALSVTHEELAKLDVPAETAAQGYGELLGQLEVALKDSSSYTIVETPWDELNGHIAGGLHAGRFYVVGARPGNGKSIAAHNIAEFAAEKGHAAQVFSVEMGALEVVGRMVSNGASIEMGEISRRELSEYSWYQFQQYREAASGYRLWVDESPELTMGHIWSVCRARKRQSGLDVAVIDYLQLVKGDSRLPREQQVGEISRGLKQLSRELGIAVVVPTQLNRRSAEKDRVSMGDLRESGSIEQDADVVMMLVRQFADDGDLKGVPTGQVLVDIPKNRHGQVVSFELPFRGHYSRIG